MRVNRTSSSPNTHVSLPPERFYWCLIHGSPWRGAGQLPIGMMPMLADEVPIDTELLHAVGAPAEDGSLVVCAMPRDELDDLTAGPLSLTPSKLPDTLGASGVDAQSVELLVGDYEPRAVRRARSARSAIVAVTIALCSIAVTLGLHRRADDARSLARRAASELASIDTASIGSALAARRALQEELARTPLRRDITGDLALLLADWPIDQGQLRSVSIDGDQVNIAATTEFDAAALIAAVRAPTGWAADEPRVTSAGEVARVSISMRPLSKDTPSGTGGRP